MSDSLKLRRDLVNQIYENILADSTYYALSVVDPPLSVIRKAAEAAASVFIGYVIGFRDGWDDGEGCL